MYGFSICLDEKFDDETKEYINNMAKSGFEGIFASFQFEPKEREIYFERLEELGKLAKELNLGLVVDISDISLMDLKKSYSTIDNIRESGVTGLRIDTGISFDIVAELSRKIKVELNGSTLTKEDIDELKNNGAYFSNLEAWHNYYPRPETGLGSTFFKEKNKWLRELGLGVMCFIPGDLVYDGPLYKGLPTLEKHRYMNRFESAMELVKKYKVDKVYIGDPRISDTLMDHFNQYINNGIYVLHAEIFDEFKDLDILKKVHTNRDDSAAFVLRSKESRGLKKETIEAKNNIDRLTGSITIDNLNYGRYEGELQITKRDLNKDEKVNVLGRVKENDLEILQYINGGDKFKLEF